jgi:hypothetical protein
MPEQLTKSDCEYILACLKYARYAFEEATYETKEIKRKQLANLYYMEEKLRTLRDAASQ